MGRPAITTEEFISRSKEIHGDKYDYTETIYTGRSVKLTVICKEHGRFEQWPCSHLAGSGCKECISDSRRTPQQIYIDKCIAKHGDRFSYTKTVYKNAHTKVIVTCNKHSDFSVIARKHLTSRDSCKQCSIESRRSDTEEFVTKAKAIHGDRYDYSLVQYTTADKPVEIICNRCENKFKSAANTHLVGCGCPVCAKTGFNVGSEISYFYIVSVIGAETFTGFGITSTVKHRFKNHKQNLIKSNCGVAGNITLIQSTGKVIYALEKYVKSTFNCKQSKVSGFKTESLKNLTDVQLLQICVDWLTDQRVEFLTSTQPVGVSNDPYKCCSSGITV